MVGRFRNLDDLLFFLRRINPLAYLCKSTLNMRLVLKRLGHPEYLWSVDDKTFVTGKHILKVTTPATASEESRSERGLRTGLAEVHLMKM